MPSKIVITKREWETLRGSAESKSLDAPSAMIGNYCTHVPVTDAARLENNVADTKQAKIETRSMGPPKQAKTETQPTRGPSDTSATGTSHLKYNNVQAETKIQSTSLQTKHPGIETQTFVGPSDIPATETTHLKNNAIHITTKQAKIETKTTSRAEQAKAITQTIGGPSAIPATGAHLENDYVQTTSKQAKTEAQPTSRRKPAKAGTRPVGRPAKKPRKARDPNKPKHPISAYIYFTFAARPHLRACGMSTSGATLGELWRSLRADERRKYEGMAADDNARYWREMAEYTASAGGRVCTVTPPPETLP